MTQPIPAAKELRAHQDKEDVQRVLAGDVDAFEGIVRRWQRPLVNLAHRFCRDRAVAEELAQEALVKIFRNLGRWQATGTFSTWMFAVALNVYRSWARKARPLFDSLDDEESRAERFLDHEPSGERPIDRLARREEAQRVRRAVLGLPAKFRDAMVVFYFQEQDLSTTAEILGRPEGTVKAHLHRGRKLLEKRLGKRLDKRTVVESRVPRNGETAVREAP